MKHSCYYLIHQGATRSPPPPFPSRYKVCSPNNSKEELLKIIDVSSLWIEILHSIYWNTSNGTHRQTFPYPGSLRLDGQTHLLSPLSTVVLRELIFLTLNKSNINFQC